MSDLYPKKIKVAILYIFEIYVLKRTLVSVQINPICCQSVKRLSLGKDPATKSDKFSEKFQTAFDLPPLPPIFGKLNCNFFYDRHGCIYARRYDGQIV